MANVKIGPLAPSIYCVHQRIAVQIAVAVNADQPDWRNRLAAVIARHLDAAAHNRTCEPRTSPTTTAKSTMRCVRRSPTASTL